MKKVFKRALFVIVPIIFMIVQLPFMPDIEAYAEPDVITVNALVRDFRMYDRSDPYTNRDFENPVDDMRLTTGLVSSDLGTDNKPVFRDSGGGQIYSAETFSQWYNTINSDDAESVNKEVTITLTLQKDSSTGNYVYEQYDFFPIDNQGFGNQGNGHNYHFTMELHSSFTYEEGSLFLDVAGDDDLWIFINKKMVADIGGVHSLESSGAIYLDELDLVSGQTYQFDLFFAERHVTQSDIRFETNIRFKNIDPTVPDYLITTSEDVPVSGVVVAEDLDFGTITYTKGNDPQHGSVTVSADGEWTYVPDTDYSGNDSFTVIVDDGDGGSAVSTVTIIVEPVNDAPVAEADAATVAQDSDAGVVIDVLENDKDADGDLLTITEVGEASNGTVTVSTENDTVTYKPIEGFSGADGFTYTISDGNGGTATAEVTVTVVPKPVNNPPIAVKDVVEVSEDGSININVIENDTDPDGDALTVTEVGMPENGTATINEDGTVDYEPNADYNGDDEFTYTISDGNGGTSTVSVYVTVMPVNDAPVAEADAATVAQDSDAGVVIDVLENDKDADGDLLTITEVGEASNGTVTVSTENDTVTYKPIEGFSGADGFTYTISDGNGGTATAEVTVTVVPKPVNNPPIAENIHKETEVNKPVSGEITATDLDNDPLSYSGNTDPEHGDVTVGTDGSWTYTPHKDYTGTDSFIVIVDDGNGGKTESTVTITVKPKRRNTSPGDNVSPNHEPVVPDYTVFTEVNTPIGGRVIATDPDKDELLYSLLSGPENGEVSAKSNGEWTYIPNTGYIGEDVFQVTVSDGNGGTAVSTITVEVEAVPLDSPKDLAVVINVDRLMIEENGVGKFTVKYYNKLDSTVKNTVVSVLVPDGAMADNYGDGVLTDNKIEWDIGDLKSHAKGLLTFDLTFGEIEVPQSIVDIEAAIASTDKLIIPEDDKSLISVLLYSQKQGTKHTRYMQGYPDGLFGPDNTITREEVAAILARILDLKPSGEGKQIYEDVSPDRWSAEYIDAVSNAELFIGSPDGNFYPKDSITRAELATVIARYLKVEKDRGVIPQEYHYNDIKGHWAANSIEEIFRFGVLLGNNDEKFEPDKTMTRVDATIMMNRMFFRGPLTGAETIWEDVPEGMPGWEDILEATISHESIYTEDQNELFMKKAADPAWQK